MNSHRRHLALPVKIEGTKSIIPEEMQISYLLFCVVIAGDAGDKDQNGSVILTGPKLREVVNLLSDPLQSYSAANILAEEARRSCLVADLLAEALAPAPPTQPAEPAPAFRDVVVENDIGVSIGTRINAEIYELRSEIVAPTETAIFIRTQANTKVWLPRSQIKRHDEDAVERAILIVQVWLAEMRVLVVTRGSFGGDAEMAAFGTHQEMGALAVAEARDLVDRLRSRCFRATLDRGVLLIVDTSGQWRDPFRFISPALVFEVLNRGLDEDPALLDPRENSL